MPDADQPRVTETPVAPRGLFDPPDWLEHDVVNLRTFVRTPTGSKFAAWLAQGEQAIGNPQPAQSSELALGKILGYRAALRAFDSLILMPAGSPQTGEIHDSTLPPLDESLPGELDPDGTIPEI